jgi:hypothetical protein
MDDFNLNTIGQSRAEWCEEFILIVKPCIMEGFDTIFDNAVKLSLERKMPNMYLTLFQQFISQIPHWNQTIIDTEKNRIVEKSKCSYLEIILSATYIAQLKILSAIRAGTKSKRVDIDIPPLANFIHKIYINAGREIYRNVYLYVRSTDKFQVSSLDVQKNRTKIEALIREGIYITFRTTIPVDKILKTYLEPTDEEEVSVKTEEQFIYDNLAPLGGGSSVPPSPATSPQPPLELPAAAAIEAAAEQPETTPMYDLEPMHAPAPTLVADDNVPDVFTPPTNDTHLSFNNFDVLHDHHGIEAVEAPKDIEHLEMRARTESVDSDILNAEVIELPNLYDDEVV